MQEYAKYSLKVWLYLLFEEYLQGCKEKHLFIFWNHAEK